ncbi:MAG: hypothetical protein HY532_04035 [Chloroflexi bacterium]|nr:hypothetical protein [Chloroflexota bacterium]
MKNATARRLILPAGALLVVRAVIGVVLYLNVLRPATTAGSEEGSQLALGETRIVDTLEEASELAGYEPGNASYIPGGFRRSKGNIQVTQPDTTYLPVRVRQTWVYEADPNVGFILLQDPGLDKLGGGEPTTVGMYEGFRALSPAGNRPYDFLTLFWTVPEMDTKYTLTGTLAAPLTEEELYRIAESVQ